MLHTAGQKQATLVASHGGGKPCTLHYVASFPALCRTFDIELVPPAIFIAWCLNRAPFAC
jgi:hypothetical protein